MHKDYKNLRAAEYYLKWNEVSRRPSCLQTFIEIEGEMTSDQIGCWVARMLLRNISDALVCNNVFGAASWSTERDTGHTSSPQIIARMQRWPRAYNLSGEYFDALHSIMINSIGLCSQLQNILGPTVQLFQKTVADTKCSFGILHLPEDVIQDSESKKIAERYLIPKNETTVTRPLGGESLGELRFGGYAYFTQRRYNQLRVEDRLPSLGESFKRRPLIDEKYCSMLGIDPLNMLLGSWGAMIAEVFQREIDDRFADLSTAMSIKDRVWEAHLGVWRKQKHPPELILYMYDHYFSDNWTN